MKVFKIDTLIWAIISYTFAILWVYGSYFKGDPYSYISFAGEDGWCDPTSEALGVHCFGDYSAIRFTGFLDQVSGPESVYLPLSRIATFFVSIPISLLGFQIGITLSAVLIYFILVGGTIRLTDGKISPMMGLYLGLCLPVVVAVDRLNTIWLAYLLLLAALATSKRTYFPIILVLLAALVKPIFCLFVYPFLPMILRKYGFRKSLLNLSGIMYLYLLSIYLWLKAVNLSSGWTLSYFIQSVRNWSAFHTGSATPADLSLGTLTFLGQSARIVLVIFLFVIVLVDLILVFNSLPKGALDVNKVEKSEFDRLDFHLRYLIIGCIFTGVQSPFWPYNLLVFLPPATWLYHQKKSNVKQQGCNSERRTFLYRKKRINGFLDRDKLETLLLIILIFLIAPVFIPSRFRVAEVYTPVMTKSDTLHNWYDLNIRRYLPLAVAVVSTSLLMIDRKPGRNLRRFSKLTIR